MGRSSLTRLDLKKTTDFVLLDLISSLSPPSSTQVQCVRPDLHQPSARGHEAAGPLQGHLEAPRPREDLQQDHRVGPSGGLLLPGQTWRLQRPGEEQENSDPLSWIPGVGK